ncbi:MAG: TIGR00730 family Rossman fold protein [Ferruginibacter sp.]
MDKKQKAQKTEIQFLEGPQSRWKEFIFTFQVMIEFIKGFRTLHFVGPCVTIFGSARFEADHPTYKQTEAIAGEVARLGFTVMTGGGPGVMEAANKGARAVGGRSVGCNIELPFEQHHNPYLDKFVNIKFFFIRKTLLIKYSYAFIVMPGGFGTLDEYFESLTLIQTKKIEQFPVIIFDKEYHKDVIAHIERMKAAGTIAPKDLDLCLFTDSVDEAIAHLQEHSIKKFGLRPEGKPKRFGWLGEN